MMIKRRRNEDDGMAGNSRNLIVGNSKKQEHLGKRIKTEHIRGIFCTYRTGAGAGRKDTDKAGYR